MHTCGELRASDTGRRALLMGWVHRRRDLGGVIFIHLRDREGVTQIVFHADTGAELHAKAEMLGSEYRHRGGRYRGKTNARNGERQPGDRRNGGGGRQALDFERIATPPFPMEETVDVKEDARLKYR